MSYQAQLPSITSQTDSIAAGASQTVTVSIPNEESWHVKRIVTTLGANTTIDTDGIRIDGVTVGLNGADLDLETEFGRLPIATIKIEVDVTSADAGAQNTTIDVRHTTL